MAELIYDELELFVVCLLLGAMLTLVYDGVRILRMLFHHWDWMVDVEDLIYWIFTAWMVFRTLFYYNRGALRGYAFLGMFLGVIVYTLTISRLLLFVAKKIVPFWNKGKNLIGKPFVILKEKCRKILKNITTEVTMALKGR